MARRSELAELRQSAPELHVLYRFFNTAGVLLYVGITNSVWRRIASHEAVQPWWAEVASATMEHHPDRKSLTHAERAAIKSEHPLYNVRHAVKAG